MARILTHTDSDLEVHPGDMVVEYLESRQWMQADLARRTGISPKTISEICSGKAPITTNTALAFEKVLGRPAHFWLSLQRQFDEKHARSQAALRQLDWQTWAKQFPIKEMAKYGILDPHPDAVHALLSFLGVSSPDTWRSVWESANAAYRQTRRFGISPESVSAWVRAVEVKAQEIDTADYSEAGLRLMLPALREQTTHKPEVFTDAIQDQCAKVGVAVVWVPELPKTGISGCTRWLTDRKVIIGLSLRYKMADQMWFTFFHEIGHVLLHRTHNRFIVDNAEKDLTDLTVDPDMQRPEEEANRFAADTLIPPEELTAFLETDDLSAQAILKFAKEIGIAPGIVIGRLQREKLLAPNQGNELKQTLRWSTRRV